MISSSWSSWFISFLPPWGARGRTGGTNLSNLARGGCILSSCPFPDSMLLFCPSSGCCSSDEVVLMWPSRCEDWRSDALPLFMATGWLLSAPLELESAAHCSTISFSFNRCDRTAALTISSSSLRASSIQAAQRFHALRPRSLRIASSKCLHWLRIGLSSSGKHSRRLLNRSSAKLKLCGSSLLLESILNISWVAASAASRPRAPRFHLLL
mmetsp:Transcript_6213/g.15236  ORF Transcript_6213/g.15236 Transcript_6213/m.15236 type:complete len:211 (+) Transcript_6213:2123-2755(+)